MNLLGRICVHCNHLKEKEKKTFIFSSFVIFPSQLHFKNLEMHLCISQLLIKSEKSMIRSNGQKFLVELEVPIVGTFQSTSPRVFNM